MTDKNIISTQRIHMFTQNTRQFIRFIENSHNTNSKEYNTTIKIINQSPLFDEVWYRLQYPEINKCKLSAASHYFFIGADINYDPGPYFETKWYAEKFPEIRKHKINPLFHFHTKTQPRNRLFHSPQKAIKYIEHLFPKKSSPAHPFESYPWRGKIPQEHELSHNKHLLFCSHELTRTGAPTCALLALKELNKREDIQIWTVFLSEGELASDFLEIGPILPLSEIICNDTTSYSKLINFFAAFKNIPSQNKIFIGNTFLTPPYLYFICHHLKLQFMPWLHEMASFIATQWDSDYARTISEISRTIIVPSKAVKTTLVDTFKMNAEKIKPLYPVIKKTHRIQTLLAKQIICRNLDIPHDSFLVLGCGSLTLLKGADIFIQVACSVFQETATEDVRFIWAGPHSEQGLLKKNIDLAKRNNIIDKIYFPGPQHRMELFYSAADLFLLTSRCDSFPLVNIEAMSHGIPVVGFTNAGGAIEAHTEDTGFFIPSQDPEAMAEVVAFFHKNSRLLTIMGSKAAQHVAEKYSPKRLATELYDILNKIYEF